LKKSTLIFLGVLAAVSLGGYLLPDHSDSMTPRILMENAGGRVVFDHAGHISKYGIACTECHHDAADNKAGLPCKTCHLKEPSKEVPAHKAAGDRYSCATCHHAVVTAKDWRHDAHSEMFVGFFEKDCRACHHSVHLEPVPQNCADCHASNVDQGKIPSVKNAVHARCAECHAGPGLPKTASEYASSKNCTSCHVVENARDCLTAGKSMDAALVSCSTCHEVDHAKLIPASMAAYHGLCIDCHKSKGGPVDNCGQCHTK